MNLPWYYTSKRAQNQGFSCASCGNVFSDAGMLRVSAAKGACTDGALFVEKCPKFPLQIPIFGAIVGRRREHVIPLLAAVEESDDIDGLLLLLNTVGGDIEAGLAIAELIAGMKKPTVSLVLGGGHSIGIPLAVSAKRAIIAPRASMTVHPVRMTGLVVGAPQTYHYFDPACHRKWPTL